MAAMPLHAVLPPILNLPSLAIGLQFVSETLRPPKSAHQVTASIAVQPSRGRSRAAELAGRQEPLALARRPSLRRPAASQAGQREASGVPRGLTALGSAVSGYGLAGDRLSAIRAKAP